MSVVERTETGSVGRARRPEAPAPDGTAHPAIRPRFSLLSMLALIVNAVMAGGFVLQWASEATKRIDGADFTSFYTGWTMVHRGMGSQLYDIAAQTQVQTELVNGSFPNGVLIFCVPPFVANLFSPIAALPIQWARFIFALINLGFAALLLRNVRKLMPDVDRASFRRFAIFAFSLSPLWATVVGGTLSLMVAAGLAGMAASLREERFVAAGLWLGLVALKPQYLPFVFVFLLARRLWRTIGVASAIGVGLFVASLPLGIDRWFEFTKLLRSISSVTVDYGINAHSMWNVRALLTRLVRGHSLSLRPNEVYVGAQPAIVGVLSTLAMVGALVVLYRSRSRDISTHALVLVVLASVFTVHGHHHDMVIMVIAFAVIVQKLATAVTSTTFQTERAMPLLYLGSVVVALAAFSGGSPLLFVGPAFFIAVGAYGVRRLRA